MLGSLFGGTGLVWYGGAIGGAACVVAWAVWRRVFDLTIALGLTQPQLISAVMIVAGGAWLALRRGALAAPAAAQRA